MPGVVKQLRKAARVLEPDALEEADPHALLDNFSPSELEDILERAEAYLDLVRCALQHQRCLDGEVEVGTRPAEA
jgi:hypothetical protein